MGLVATRSCQSQFQRMRQASETIVVDTGGKGLVELTDRVRDFAGAKTGC